MENENSTAGDKTSEGLIDFLPDLKVDFLPDLIGQSNVQMPQADKMVEGIKNKTKPRLVFLDENKKVVSNLRREKFENSDSQDVKKLEEEFYIQLEDPSQTGKGSVPLTLFALGADGKERALDGIMLHETSPGKFVSKAQLLINKKEKSLFSSEDLFEDFYPVKKHEVELGEIILAENKNGQIKTEAEAPCVPTAKLAQVWPAVLNEDGQLVSTLPKQPPFMNVMTEINPAQEKVAHREMQMQFDKSLAGKTVTWTLAPLAIAAIDGENPPVLVGDLKNSPKHKDYFEAATALGKSDFRRVSQNTAVTVIDDEGFTSIRTNLPPIAFNKAQVRMQVEGISVSQEAANFIVPGVVVIDPGHGGIKSIPNDSAANHAVSPSGVLEKNKTLEVGMALKNELKILAQEKNLPIQVHMTRATDVNLGVAKRAGVAKDQGADVFLSIHFNGGTKTTRGTEAYYRAAKNNNVNLTEDIQLATSVTQAIEHASVEVDPKYKRQKGGGGVREDTKSQFKQLGILNDKYLGNTADYHPTRAVLAEVDYLTNSDLDGLMKDNKLVNAWAKGMAGALINDMVSYHQTAQAAQTTEQKEQKEEKEEEKKTSPKVKIK